MTYLWVTVDGPVKGCGGLSEFEMATSKPRRTPLAKRPEPIRFALPPRSIGPGFTERPPELESDPHICQQTP